MFARMVVLLAAVLLAALAWHAVQRLLHPPETAVATGVAASGAGHGASVAARESQVIGALEAATAEGSAGNISGAEVDVDRAARVLASTRMGAQPAAPEFFDIVVRGLDRALRTQPENQRLFEHVTLARIELAELRSAQSLEADGSGGATASPGSRTTARHAVAIPGHVILTAPRSLVEQSIFDPSTAKGNYIDATLMPETAEIILPPATRLFVDDVRVEGLTFEGASQTLDGIHWKNVTFINTRLRYESGEVSLSNVRFVRCTFGFSTDDRGARLASAIALGQTSFVIE
jgi:hypothetical protein